MKKITGFFMAILPFFVTVLLFISGMIVKDITHVYVSAVQFDAPSNVLEIKKEDDLPKTANLKASVLPKNATNPELKFDIKDSNIISYAENVVTANNYGQTYIYATSVEDPTKKASCKVDVWDDKVHALNVKNSFEAGYLPFYGSIKLDVQTIPSGRIKQDPKIQFDVVEGQENIRVSPDGEVTAICPDNAGTKTAKIKVKCGEDTESKDAKPAELTIKIGAGVKYIDLVDPSETVIADTTYDLGSQVKTYPDTLDDIETKKTELRYESSDESIATVNEYGIVQFKLPGKVSITVRNARNSEISVSKTIICTSNKLYDVNFNQYSYIADVGEFTTNNELNGKINWSVYPATENQKDLTITSSNTNVVEVLPTEKGPKLIARNAGSATLTASLKIDEETTKTDICLVTLTSKPSAGGTIFKKDYSDTDPLVISSCYYDLTKNIDFNKINPNLYDRAGWKLGDQQFKDFVEISSEGILTFKKTEVAIPVTYTLNDTDYTFWIQCQNIPTTEISEEDLRTTTLKLSVGQKYILPSGYTPDTSSGSIPSWSTQFYIEKLEDGRYEITPKSGCVETDFPFKEGLIIHPRMTAIITEPASAIKFNNANVINDVYATISNEVTLTDSLLPEIIPSTAINYKGESYEIKYDCKPDAEVATYDAENKKISFKQSGLVPVKMSINGINYAKTIYIISSLNAPGKFVLNSTTTNATYQSGDTISLTPGSTDPITLDVSCLLDGFNVHQSERLFNVSKVIDNQITTAKKVVANDKLLIELTNNNTTYGTETVLISTPTFNFFLNVKVDPQPTNVVVSYHGKQLTQLSNNVTYLDSLKLDVTVTPVVSKDFQKFIWSWDNGAYSSEVTDGKIDLTPTHLTEGSHTLKIKSGVIEKEYEIEYKSTITDFNLVEADETNGLYIDANATRAIATVSVGGIVDDSVFDDFTLTCEGTTVTKSVNKFVIDGLEEPSETKQFTTTVKLSYPGATSKEYKLTREMVSQIVLPKHDDFDESDAKGLQKVHVYGDKSFYNTKEGLIDYYKLPIDLYNYKHEKFTGEAKKLAYQTIVKSINQKATAEYSEDGDGFIKVKFNKDNLYTFDEVAENKFDSLINKNVTFRAYTHNYNSYAQYTFVPVDGINSYVQEAFRAAGDATAVVLQTNFGLEISEEESKTIENTPFTDWELGWLYQIYGNGYTMNFMARNQKRVEGKIVDGNFYASDLVNVVIKGASDKTKIDDFQAVIDIRTKSSKAAETKQHNVRYCEFYRLCDGIRLNDDHQNNEPTYIRDCVFHDNRIAGILSKGPQVHLQIEDCVFFNCSRFALDLTIGGSIYLKGFVDIYNFRGKEMLAEWGAEFLFDSLILPPARREGAVQIHPKDGSEVINSCIAALLSDQVFIYQGLDEKGQEIWEQTDHGNPLGANHIFKYAQVGLPGKLNVAMWGTRSPDKESGCPSVYDEFDNNGEVRTDFLPTQLVKITRQVKYF